MLFLSKSRVSKYGEEYKVYKRMYLLTYNELKKQKIASWENFYYGFTIISVIPLTVSTLLSMILVSFVPLLIALVLLLVPLLIILNRWELVLVTKDYEKAIKLAKTIANKELARKEY